MMRLYYAQGGCSLASHIALEEAGAPFEAVRLDFAAAEQRGDAYLKVNPKGRVPALQTEHGVLTETVAILAFIAQSFPQAELAPLDDPWAFAQAQAFNAYLAATVHVAHAHRRRGARWATDPEVIAHLSAYAPTAVGAAHQLIEDELLKGPWVLGDAYSICDPYLFTIFGWFGNYGDIARFPRLSAHHDRMKARPAVQRALARERQAA